MSGLAIEVRWLNGRFHATPWGRHVNEGANEWPPSPWRLLRALISSYKLQAADVAEWDVQRLLDCLSAQPPKFYLPASSTGHTRHYVPTVEGRRLMLDAFTVIDPEGDPVVFLWPELELSAQEQALLDRLLFGIGYLGRAESWARLRRSVRRWPVVSAPLRADDTQWEVATVLCAAPGVTMAQLLKTTKSLRRKGYSRPPGSAFITYHVPRERPGPAPEVVFRPTMASFLLATTVSRADCIVLAHRVRRRLLQLGEPSPTLLGREGGVTRKDGHRHLHVLPEGAPRLERVLLWAPEGFCSGDLRLISQLDSLPAEGGKPALPVLFAEFVTAGPDHFGRAEIWRSSTPYLCARHPKADGRDGVQNQIRRECASRGLPEPEIETIDGDGTKYKVHRGRKPGPVGTQSWHRLAFREPVAGPLCLGASSHFGMGRFVPEKAIRGEEPTL